ncbi:2-amino-4-hydroxy-6-hydroxymethyldihydropteridine diphosphokinase [Bradyrhizobium yuanmingense]
MASVLIALGGNVGDVRATFKKAIAHICGMAQAALIARSSDYTTPPWGDEDQDPFINACIEIETSASIRMRYCSCCRKSSRNSAAREPRRGAGVRARSISI